MGRQIDSSPITATLVFNMASLVGKLPVRNAMYSQKCIIGKLVFRPVDLDAFPWYMSSTPWDNVQALIIMRAPIVLASERMFAVWRRTVCSSEKIPGAVSYTHLTLPTKA